MARRILIVDDELNIRMVLEEILKGQGFEVATARMARRPCESWRARSTT